MKVKINSKYLISKIKFNINCKQEEKTGTGPGSCGGKQDIRDGGISQGDRFVDIFKRPDGSFYVKKGDKTYDVSDRKAAGNLVGKLFDNKDESTDQAIANKYAPKNQSNKSNNLNSPNVQIKSTFDEKKFGNKFNDIYSKNKYLQFAIDSYVMNSDINAFLGNRIEYIKSLKENDYSDKAIEEDIQIKDKFISSIDSMFDSSELVDHPDITVLRGINGDLLETILSSNPEILTPGTEFKNTPFMSVTSSKKMQKFFSESTYGYENKPKAFVEIVVPRGIPIAYLGNKFSETYPELAENADIVNVDIKEWLLPRDLKVTVVSVKKTGNDYNMKWKISRK